MRDRDRKQAEPVNMERQDYWEKGPDSTRDLAYIHSTTRFNTDMVLALLVLMSTVITITTIMSSIIDLLPSRHCLCILALEVLCTVQDLLGTTTYHALLKPHPHHRRGRWNVSGPKEIWIPPLLA